MSARHSHRSWSARCKGESSEAAPAQHALKDFRMRKATTACYRFIFASESFLDFGSFSIGQAWQHRQDSGWDCHFLLWAGRAQTFVSSSFEPAFFFQPNAVDILFSFYHSPFCIVETAARSFISFLKLRACLNGEPGVSVSWHREGRGEKTAKDGWDDGYGSETRSWVASSVGSEKIQALTTAEELPPSSKRVTARPRFEHHPSALRKPPRFLRAWARERPGVGTVFKLIVGSCRHCRLQNGKSLCHSRWKKITSMIEKHAEMNWIGSTLRKSATAFFVLVVFLRCSIHVQFKMYGLNQMFLHGLRTSPFTTVTHFKFQAWVNVCLHFTLFSLMAVRLIFRKNPERQDSMGATKVG